jgi:glycosyltransferase involved in cell wall biosynthesis
MERNFPLVSIIIPCRNEAKFIEKCLDSLIEQNYPKEKMEILVVDGMSEDKTREIIKDYLSEYRFIRFLDNPKKFTPFGFNIGIKQSRGNIVIRMDAHTTYQNDYISKCLKYLYKYNTDNVGGITKILPSKDNLIGKAIALSLSNSFGVGNAYYKAGQPAKPRWVDTVFGGCYKKEVFEKIGLFNENLVRSQDLEFNLRLKKAGGKILLVPEIVSYYYAKSNLKDFFIHNFEDGIWAIYPLKFVKTPFRLRHYFPLLFTVGLIGSALLAILFPVFLIFFLFIVLFYFLVNFYFSLKIAIGEKDFRYFFIMPIVFFARHFGYGLGSILGLIKLLQ